MLLQRQPVHYNEKRRSAGVGGPPGNTAPPRVRLIKVIIQEERVVQHSRQITPRILVATDFSAASERAFFHALAFAVKHQARLTLLHTGSERRDAVPWERFPGVRETLAEWGLLPADAPRTAVAETLNLNVAKMTMRDDDPRQGITEYLRKHPTDLLVMATEGRTGLGRLLNPSVADTVSYLTKSHTLMLPRSAQGFVDPATGASSLKHVLCALDPDKDPRPALLYLRHWLPVMAEPGIEVVFLRTDAWITAPELSLPHTEGQSWRVERRRGDPVDALISTARDLNADLVVVNTRGPRGPFARLKGSRTDRILRRLGLPLLSIPGL